MNFLCKCLGGSNMYGLNSPESDVDWRGVYLNTDLSRIIGLDTDRFDTIDRKGEVDEVYYELRHFLRLLRKTNSTVMELLFNEKWMEVSPEWNLISENREKLIDSERFFVSLTGGDGKAQREQGYIGNEIRLMMGERTGLLGSKRKNNLDTYGYSYKNACQALRLIYSAVTFYTKGYFETDFTQNPHFELVKDIKFNPVNYTPEQARELVEEARRELFSIYDQRKISFKFDQAFADNVCLKIYKKYL